MANKEKQKLIKYHKGLGTLLSKPLRVGSIKRKLKVRRINLGLK